MTRKQYRFNPQTVSYERVRDPLRLRLYRALRKGIVLFIAACVLNLLYSSFYYTPKLRRLERQNYQMLFRYGILNEKIEINRRKLLDIKDRDNNVYRRIFAADTMHIPGVYVPYPYTRYADMAGNTYGTVMTESWMKLDEITRMIYLQSVSFDQLQVLSMSKEEVASAVPAIWPIDRRNLRKMDSYGLRMHPIYKRRIMHKGTDLGAHIGDPVYATGDAVVKSTDKGLRRRGYGQQILLDHGFGYQTRYAHLSSIDVVPGQVIKRGEQIGLVGSTGGSTGPHLHYEVIYRGKTVDPINYLKRDMDESEFEQIISSANQATFETELQ